MTKETKQTHQIYGPSAIRVACGRKITSDIKTALPGKGVTCKTCQKVEVARKRDADSRKLKLLTL